MGVAESWEKMGKSKVAAMLKYQDEQGKKLGLTDKKLLPSSQRVSLKTRPKALEGLKVQRCSCRGVDKDDNWRG